MYKNCDNGVQSYNNSKICLSECNNDYPFLDISTKKFIFLVNIMIMKTKYQI